MEHLAISFLLHVVAFAGIARSQWGKSGGDIATGALTLLSLPFTLAALCYLFGGGADAVGYVVAGCLLAQGVNRGIFGYLRSVRARRYAERE